MRSSFEKRKVRLAMQLRIDRQTYARTILSRFQRRALIGFRQVGHCRVRETHEFVLNALIEWCVERTLRAVISVCSVATSKLNQTCRAKTSGRQRVGDTAKNGCRKWSPPGSNRGVRSGCATSPFRCAQAPKQPSRGGRVPDSESRAADRPRATRLPAQPVWVTAPVDARRQPTRRCAVARQICSV